MCIWMQVHMETRRWCQIPLELKLQWFIQCVLRIELEFMQDTLLTAEPSVQPLKSGEHVGLNWGHLVFLTLLYSVLGSYLVQLCKYFISFLEAEHKTFTFFFLGSSR